MCRKTSLEFSMHLRVYTSAWSQLEQRKSREGKFKKSYLFFLWMCLLIYCFLSVFWSSRHAVFLTVLQPFFSCLFLFGCTWSSLLHRLFSSCWGLEPHSSCSVQASHCGGFSRCGAQALEWKRPEASRPGAQEEDMHEGIRNTLT